MKSATAKFLFSMTAATLLALNANAQSSSGPIKIGIVQAQTGALADAFGIPTTEGAILALEQINAKGGIGGRKLEAIVRDDRTSIQPTVIATQEIARDPDIIAMIGPSTSGASMAIRQIINQNTLPELTVAYGTALTREDFKYFYRVGPSLDMGNQALLNAIKKRRGDGQKLATLAETLRLVGSRVPLLIEIKAPDRHVVRLCAAVRRALEGYRGQAAVMSFNPEIGRWFGRHAPRIVRGLVVTEQDKRGVKGRIERHLALWRARPDFLAYDIRDLPSRFAAGQRRRGIKVLTWTVRSEDELARAAAHADQIIYEAI